MFNFFKKKSTPVEDTRSELDKLVDAELNGMPQPLPRSRPMRAPSANKADKAKLSEPEPVIHYTVGNDSAGRVVLRVGDYNSITLTMNTASTRHLIKALKAAMQDEDTVAEPA